MSIATETPTAPSSTADDESRLDDGQLLELLLEASTDGVMDWDLAADRIRYTDRWKLLLGYEASSLPDSLTLWEDLSHPDDLPRVRELLQDHLDSFWPFSHTWRMRHHNGEWRWVLARAVAARQADGRAVRLAVVFSDITDRIRAEERHRALASAIPDLMLRVRKDGLLMDVKPPDGPAPSGIAWPAIGQALSAWSPALGWHQRAIDGVGAPPFAFEAVLGTGQTQRQAEVRVVPSGDNEVVCIVRDVTEQRQMQVQLMQTHKLESIGQLAAGIAHEINTPMQYIGDNLIFTQDSCTAMLTIIDAYHGALAAAGAQPVDAATRADIDRLLEEQDLDYVRAHAPGAIRSALDGVSRVARIVLAMKEFSHPGKTEKAASDLNRSIETTITVGTNVWKHVAQLDIELDRNLPLVVCHPGEINQVVLNLLVNAAHAIVDRIVQQPEHKGHITISTIARNGHAEIRVADNGCGIPEHVRGRIFDPFFTTKEVGRGTGQGLAIARNTVVDKHGGTLEFETEIDRGTTFVVRLPLAPNQSAD